MAEKDNTPKIEAAPQPQANPPIAPVQAPQQQMTAHCDNIARHWYPNNCNCLVMAAFFNTWYFRFDFWNNFLQQKEERNGTRWNNLCRSGVSLNDPIRSFCDYTGR